MLGWAVEQYEGLKTGPVLVYILKDFDKTLTEWGYVAALAGFVYSGGAVLLSRAADRFGRRPLLVYPVFAYAAISVAGAVAPNFFTLACLAMAGSFVVAGMNPAVHAASRDLTPRMGRAMVYSWVSLAFTIGALMSTAVAAHTLPIWPGWRSQYWIAAVLGGVTALILFVFYRGLSYACAGRTSCATARRRRNESGGRGELLSRRPRDLPQSTAVAAVVHHRVLVDHVRHRVGLRPYIPRTALSPRPGARRRHYVVLLDRVHVQRISLGVVVRSTARARDDHRVRRRYNRRVFSHWRSIAGGYARCNVGAGVVAHRILRRLHLSRVVRDLLRNRRDGEPARRGRAFGITATLAPISGLFLNLGLPRVVTTFGWPTWMMVAGLFGAAVLVSFGEIPWWVPRAHRRNVAVAAATD